MCGKKVIVFGANGLLGQHVWQAALAAGHTVTVYLRSPQKLADVEARAQLQVVQGDVMDAEKVKEACTGNEIVVSCVSPAGGNSTLDMAKSIVGNAVAAGVKKFYLVGGAGALWVPGTDETKVVADCDDLAPFGIPSFVTVEKMREMTKGHIASMAYMKETGLEDYTYICPPVMVEGPATPGRAVYFEARMDGTSKASKVNLGDVAQVIVDDLNEGKLFGKRVRVESGEQ